MLKHWDTVTSRIKTTLLLICLCAILTNCLSTSLCLSHCIFPLRSCSLSLSLSLFVSFPPSLLPSLSLPLSISHPPPPFPSLPSQDEHIDLIWVISLWFNLPRTFLCLPDAGKPYRCPCAYQPEAHRRWTQPRVERPGEASISVEAASEPGGQCLSDSLWSTDAPLMRLHWVFQYLPHENLEGDTTVKMWKSKMSLQWFYNLLLSSSCTSERSLRLKIKPFSGSS